MNKPDLTTKTGATDSVNVLQIRKIGNSLGLILPREMLARLKLKEGDALHVVEQPNGAFRLVKQKPDFDKAMEAARRGMKIYHDALAELAK
ncbi:AbrB/MazE/SpoVT family DNA-binding domain-containing protein [Bosea psychrotolerans]|uniref:Putative addiction module antidote n=1 Tax=Bosea psychrotolerans TaxID=1871628 RepID=A0A2S4M5Q5_9HYPH|nr:AbrB/MazE/SpoVT family DNA-binding domain-containing protein [Bosea psychrotolerans]POR49957.1 putative addiction module antidote [Bosea psychrotolerans]